MGLPIMQFAQMGFALAKSLAPDAFKLAKIRLGPTSVVDPVADTAATSWEVEIEKDLFAFDDEDERKTLPLNTRQKTFLLNPADYPPGAKFAQTGQIDDLVGTVWEVYRAEIAPAGVVVIFYGRA